MISEEIKKMFRRIEIDKSNDSCGFEFADGFDCTFDNIATCYDDRLKLYDLVKKLQQENNQLKEDGIYLRKENLKFRNEKYELRSWLEEEKNRLARECSQIYEDSLGKTRLVNEDIFNEVNRVLSKLNE